MIWHYNIGKYFMMICIQVVKPFINEVVAICNFKKGKPAKAGEGDEENT